MDVLEVFRAKGRQLCWLRLDDAKVVGRPSGEPFKPESAYVVVRLTEMFLGTTRVLWRKRSPLVHTFVTLGAGKEQHAVAGPGQLQELGNRSLERVIVLDYRVAGPTPYRGEELQLLMGLYSVPREDTAAALISTVSALTGLIAPGSSGAVDVANVVKAGVDSIMGLGETELRLGVNDTFSASKPLRSGFMVGIGAPRTDMDLASLWLKDGHLMQGRSLALANPYTAHDYFVVHIERLERLPDWPSVPGLGKYEARFSTILSSGKPREQLYADLGAAWPEFREVLRTSPHLTRHDAEEIAQDVTADLKQRVERIAVDNPFLETRAFGASTRLDLREVDFATVPHRQGGHSGQDGFDPALGR